MGATYNASVANLVDPLSTSPLSSPSHAGQHTEINDALQTLGTWTVFTPTWTGLTIGNGLNDFRYTIFNKVMMVTGAISFGTTTVMGTDPRMTIPASATAIGESWVLTRMLDSASDNYYGTAVASGTFIYLYRLSDSGVDDPRLRGINATTPFTWAVNDTIWLNLTFPIS